MTDAEARAWPDREDRANPPPEGMDRWIAKVRLPDGRAYVQDFFVSRELLRSYGTGQVEQLLVDKVRDIAEQYVENETNRLLKGADDE